MSIPQIQDNENDISLTLKDDSSDRKLQNYSMEEEKHEGASSIIPQSKVIPELDAYENKNRKNLMNQILIVKGLDHKKEDFNFEEARKNCTVDASQKTDKFNNKQATSNNQTSNFKTINDIQTSKKQEDKVNSLKQDKSSSLISWTNHKSSKLKLVPYLTLPALSLIVYTYLIIKYGNEHDLAVNTFALIMLHIEKLGSGWLHAVSLFKNKIHLEKTRMLK